MDRLIKRCLPKDYGHWELYKNYLDDPESIRFKDWKKVEDELTAAMAVLLDKIADSIDNHDGVFDMKFPEVKSAIADFAKVMTEYGDWGTGDSEPGWAAVEIVECFLNKYADDFDVDAWSLRWALQG